MFTSNQGLRKVAVSDVPPVVGVCSGGLGVCSGGGNVWFSLSVSAGTWQWSFPSSSCTPSPQSCPYHGPSQVQSPPYPNPSSHHTSSHSSYMQTTSHPSLSDSGITLCLLPPRARGCHGDDGPLPWQHRPDISLCVCVCPTAVPELDPPIDTNLIEFETK